MHIPVSTYRLQLHKDFTFAHLRQIIDYLRTLGATTLYAAPVMQATPGSPHGYDVTDPHTINPEIGTLDELKTIAAQLKKYEMSWLQDIVPNHMAFHTLNFRLMDVLERGPSSPYYRYFDIDWNHHLPFLKGKVMAPILGNELEACVANGEISLSFSENGLNVNYFDHAYPLSLKAYPVLISFFDDAPWKQALNNLMEQADVRDYTAWKTYKLEQVKMILNDRQLQDALQSALAFVNRDLEKLQQLLRSQYYLLTYWKHADLAINYRRFFTINELICLRMEDENVFNEYHSLLIQLYRQGIVQGFRIDHIDGLNDPLEYVKRLRSHTGEACYIVAEKILEAKEEMPYEWPLQGTSGYEFLSYVSNLFTYRKGARQLLQFYRELVPELPGYMQLVWKNKRLILEEYMQGEWDNLFHYFLSLRLDHPYEPSRMKQALAWMMVAMPVYRIYPDRMPLRGRSLAMMEETIGRALMAAPEYREELQFLRSLFIQPETNDNEKVLRFLKRLMQFTGPLTAKGVEDTTFYIYNPLISHDEVGDTPSALGITVTDFHASMIARLDAMPLALNATATHDTKRGEDARLRLNVLSEVPDEWQRLVRKWIAENESLHQTVAGKRVPGMNEEYFIYQSLVGGFPEDFVISDEWQERFHAYLVKAMRESKLNTSWADPDEAYEESCWAFAKGLLQAGHPFLSSFLPFVKKISHYASVYSLAQTLVRITAPGIPDTYQGCELMDLSFVDPDNRRPVDFQQRMAWLKEIMKKEKEGSDVLFPFLQKGRNSGLEKLFLTWKALNFRKAFPRLFSEGTYIPLSVTGDETVAMGYARCFEDQWAIIVVPLRLAMSKDEQRYGSESVVLPENAPFRWYNVLTGQIATGGYTLPLSETLKIFPVALLNAMKG